MISGSNSTELYYLKYLVDDTIDAPARRLSAHPQHSNIAAAAAAAAATHSTCTCTGFRVRAPPPVPPPTGRDRHRAAGPQPAHLVTDTETMLTGRLAISLSLVGWRVKPDPGD